MTAPEFAGFSDLVEPIPTPPDPRKLIELMNRLAAIQRWLYAAQYRFYTGTPIPPDLSGIYLSGNWLAGPPRTDPIDT